VNGFVGIFSGGVIEVVIAASVIIYVLELQKAFDLSAIF